MQQEDSFILYQASYSFFNSVIVHACHVTNLTIRVKLVIASHGRFIFQVDSYEPTLLIMSGLEPPTLRLYQLRYIIINLQE